MCECYNFSPELCNAFGLKRAHLCIANKNKRYEHTESKNKLERAEGQTQTEIRDFNKQ